MVGLPPTTLRFYDRLGLLPARRSPGGFRLYDDGAIGRVQVISAGKYLGLPLQEICDLLTALDGGLCAEVRDRLRPPLAALATVTPCLADAVAGLDDAQQDAAGESVGLSGAAAVSTEAPSPCTHLPVACSLPAGDAAARVADWHGVLARARERCDVECGVIALFSIELAGRLAELVVAEQRCCPFFGFGLQLRGDEVRLEVRAPREAEPMLADIFGFRSGRLVSP